MNTGGAIYINSTLMRTAYFPAYAWTHVALVKIAETMLLAIDGVFCTVTAVCDANFNLNNNILIGNSYNFFFMDEFRVRSGINFKSDFVPSTAPYESVFRWKRVA